MVSHDGHKKTLNPTDSGLSTSYRQKLLLHAEGFFFFNKITVAKLMQEMVTFLPNPLRLLPNEKNPGCLHPGSQPAIDNVLLT